MIIIRQICSSVNKTNAAGLLELVGREKGEEKKIHVQEVLEWFHFD